MNKGQEHFHDEETSPTRGNLSTYYKGGSRFRVHVTWKMTTEEPVRKDKGVKKKKC